MITDREWKAHAFRVQTNSFDIYGPRLSNAYSHTFSDLPSVFKWIQQVAQEIQRSVGKASTQEVTTASQEDMRTRKTDGGVTPLKGPPSGGNLKGPTIRVAAANVVSKESEPEEYEWEEHSGDENEYTTDVNMVRLSSSEDEQIEKIVNILDIRQSTVEKVVNGEEWSKIDPSHRLFENGPRTWAAIHTIIGRNTQQIDLRSRLKLYFQTLIDKLCKYVGIGRLEIRDSDMRCQNNPVGHLNPGSHSAMTCARCPSTCPFMSTFNQRCVAALALDVLKVKCEEAAWESCRREGKCAQEGYKNCRAMKDYYFKVCLPIELVTSWEGLEGYKQQQAEKQTMEQGTRKRIKQLMVSTVIQALTVVWERADRK